MSIMDRMERKVGRSKGPNLMMILIICYAAGFVINFVAPAIEDYICFSPALILKGQVWRLFTWIIYADASNLLLAALTCFIYFSLTRSLEQFIGRFRLNFFLLLGLVLEVIFGFLYYFIMDASVLTMPYENYVTLMSPMYLYEMLFVLFAMIFPDAQFLLMFIIPVKGKWMIFITLAFYALDVARAFLVYGSAPYAWLLIAMILAAILTLVIYILLSGGRKAGRGPVVFMKPRRNPAPERKGARHKCAICGRTELTNPELDFRYCSKCVGNYEYCSEHLYTHIHKTGPQA